MRDGMRLVALRATAATLARVVAGRAHPRWRQFLRESWGGVRLPARGRPVIWVVCAAGGEVVQARGFGPALRGAWPGSTLVLSTSHHAFVELGERIGGFDACCYTPWDVPGAARRALRAVQPDVLVTVEAAWNPVLLREARRRRVPTMLASGTMIADYHRAAPYTRPMRLGVLPLLDVVGVKSEAEVAAFTARGVPAARVRVLGDLRLDPTFYRVDPARRAALATRVGLRPGERVFVAGSIHAGEETAVLDAARVLREKLGALRVVVAPRHMALLPALERACVERGLPSRRLTAPPGPEPAAVVIVDTYGDLPALYALASWAFLGGTLARIDLGLGQNILEPLAHGVPVFFGPHVRRWTAITDELLQAAPGLAVTGAGDLAQGVLDLERAPDVAAALVARAAALMSRGPDATARHVAAIGAVLATAPGHRAA